MKRTFPLQACFFIVREVHIFIHSACILWCGPIQFRCTQFISRKTYRKDVIVLEEFDSTWAYSAALCPPSGTAQRARRPAPCSGRQSHLSSTGVNTNRRRSLVYYECRDFVKAGAEQGLTPSDVIQAADITFSCVADPQAAKDMVFGNCGVLVEITPEKGYVEMTGIDAETSQDIAEAINAKGGRYLEAQVQGSKIQAEEGTLVILAAGDRSLFDECQSCFKAMGKNSFYLGEVGNASKMNLVLQLMTGVTLAGLAEGMALADRAGLQQKDVLEVLELTSLACPTLVDKGRAIIDGSFPTHLPLEHMQKDLKLSLIMGDQLEQPLPLTASTNELFKHAKRLGYGSHDASAVYIRARF